MIEQSVEQVTARGESHPQWLLLFWQNRSAFTTAQGRVGTIRDVTLLIPRAVRHP